MPGEVKVTIRREMAPSPADRLLGTVWGWDVCLETGLHAGLATSGWAYTEKGARRMAHRAARQILDNEVIEYTYNPEGLL